MELTQRAGTGRPFGRISKTSAALVLAGSFLLVDSVYGNLNVLSGALICGPAIKDAGERESYRLQPEDVVRIKVFNQQQIDAEIPVGVDGMISAPFVGGLKVEGKTLDEVQKDLLQMYKTQLKLRDPIVSVTIVAYRRLKASVSGMVQRSGDVAIRPGDTIMTLFAAGGEVVDQSDLRRATLRRRGSKELIPIDLYALHAQGDNSQNYEVKDGDNLDIPREERNRILVLGAIKQPGMYPYRETMRLSDAIGVAGGEIRYLSRFSKVFILREIIGQPGEYKRIDADYVKFVKGNDFKQNVKLMPGDFIYVPETNTPDANQLQSYVNSAFILNTFGGFFGLRLFGN